jgi:glycosyltransferase involved in cell wall biosynthesis
MREAFRGFGSLHMVCVSPWQEKRLKESVICGGLPCSVIGNGIDTAVFRPSERGAAAQEKIIILQVTAHFSDDPEDIKGGKYLIDLAEQLGGAYEIRVAGAVYLSQEARLPDNITLLGNISDQNRLADEYRNADLTVLTSRRETFGMACAESLCCGTPVVGFACGGTESIALPEYTGFCEFGNVEALREEVLGMGSRKRTMSAQEADMMARLAAETYAKRTMADAYDKLYQELIESAEGRTGGNDGN